MSDELDTILNLAAEARAWRHEKKWSEAKEALRAYILAEVLNIVGEDEPTINEEISDLFYRTRNGLRVQLRQALTAKFGGSKDAQP